MDRVVFYHHPLAESFSLAQSSESPHELLRRSRNADAPSKLLGYPFDTPVYVRYVGDSRVRTVAEAEFDRERLAAEIAALPEPAQIVAFRLFELFQAAVAATDTEQFKLYKQFDPQRVEGALDRVSWGAELPRVAGELMSNLILRHGLPNANHRTGIGMAQACIETVDAAFQMPRTHRDDQHWKGWVDQYIVESKRLITVRRNNLYFKSLARLGVDVVQRKEGTRIALSEYELDITPSTARQKYAREHERLCREFVTRVLETARRPDLCETSGPSLGQFVTYLDDSEPRGGDIELF